MSHYRIGFCPQCDAQIMVQDVSGRWNSFKPNHANIDLIFPDGHRVRSLICKTCAQAPDYVKLMAAILHPESQACNERVKTHIKYRHEQHEVDEPFEMDLEDDDGKKKKYRGTRKVLQTRTIERGNPVKHQVR